MSKPSSYDLLLQMQSQMNRLEDKMDKRIEEVEIEVKSIRKELAAMAGKVSLGVLVGSLVLAGVINFVFTNIKQFFGGKQ